MDSRGSSVPPSRPVPVDSEEPLPWVREGIIAGVVGAAVVAVFFFVVDLAAGRPLWTPNALGTALFLDRMPASGEPLSPALIGGYTFAHGYVFVSVGLIMAFLLSTSGLLGRPRWLQILALAVSSFLLFTLIFFAFGMLRGPGAARPFGLEAVALTNALSAAAMAACLVLRLKPTRA